MVVVVVVVVLSPGGGGTVVDVLGSPGRLRPKRPLLLVALPLGLGVGVGLVQALVVMVVVVVVVVWRRLGGGGQAAGRLTGGEGVASDGEGVASGVGLAQQPLPLRGRRRRGGGRGGGGGAVEEWVVVGGSVVVMGRLGGQGGHLWIPLLRRQEGGAVADGGGAGSPGRNLGHPRTRRHLFVEIIPARQQAVVGQAPVARRVVRRRRLIG